MTWWGATRWLDRVPGLPSAEIECWNRNALSLMSSRGQKQAREPLCSRPIGRTEPQKLALLQGLHRNRHKIKTSQYEWPFHETSIHPFLFLPLIRGQVAGATDSPGKPRLHSLLPRFLKVLIALKIVHSSFVFVNLTSRFSLTEQWFPTSVL